MYVPTQSSLLSYSSNDSNRIKPSLVELFELFSLKASDSHVNSLRLNLSTDPRIDPLNLAPQIPAVRGALRDNENRRIQHAEGGDKDSPGSHPVRRSGIGCGEHLLDSSGLLLLRRLDARLIDLRSGTTAFQESQQGIHSS